MARGGSYIVDPETGEARLVSGTAEWPLPHDAPAAEAPPEAPAEPEAPPARRKPGAS